ncbi:MULTISPECIES: Gfo/Idh/MocA family protein [Corynebacterium]|uniref:Gfo/Idh/MocA family protein n=1 Tax=Corynebacterium TaxID=1716 RepID=UPI0019581497|nr:MULTISPECIES: Gfo/Idh/MocA family oxidoreductase [Corynebacterium]MDN8623908.1 Gfo/Idh/MocA family oxidoreductase [Corynebacterium kroppenstedtii]QRQ64281.1 Gfo/Idh/MocA family oxidoreductase [Corynebacterium kroppenstedtii]
MSDNTVENTSSNTTPDSPGHPYRFAVVGLGQIAQQAFLPGLAQLPEAQLDAVVTSDPNKAERYHVPGYSYDRYQELLDSGDIDAVYVATPVDRHREFTIPALHAGIPVLCEKPMAPSVDDCQAMLDAADKTGTTLMLAYRMHTDPFMTDLVELVRSGKLGEARYFTSQFSHTINPENHRANHGFWGGPVPDLGVYALNMARNLYEEEPTTVYAIGGHHEGTGLDTTPTVSVSLGFDSGRTAQFTTSYSTSSAEGFTLAASKGTVVSPSAYMWGEGSDLHATVSIADEEGSGTDTTEEWHYNAKDQFAGETRYFLRCVNENKSPEPNGEEGLLDIRVCEAVKESLETGRPVSLEPRTRERRISPDEAQKIPAPSKPGEDDIAVQATEEL